MSSHAVRFLLPSALALAALLAGAPVSVAQTWKLVTPGSTGIPGEEVRTVRFAPDGLLWVGARWPFWSDGGIGLYDRAADLWTTLSNVDGGFPSAFVNDMAFGADGTTWIATDNGLVRRHAGQNTVWTSANSPLLHNTIRSLDLAPNGHVWINNSNVQNNTAAIFEFDGSTWTSHVVGVQLPWAPPWKALSDVMVDHLGHVWVCNDVLNGVAEWNGATWTLHGAGVSRFGEAREDTAGNIWLSPGVGGTNAFWKFDHTAFTVFPEPTNPTAIGIDDDGAVYLGNWNGRIRKTTNGGQSFTTFATGLNTVYSIEPEQDGTGVWVGTPGAVGQFAASGALVRDFNTTNTGMPDYFVERFNLDSAGHVWLATGEAGLSRFDGLRWRNWGAHNAGSEPYPFAGNEPMGSFLLDSTGTGWMGGNGIARWNPQSGQFTGFWNWQNNPGMGVTMIEYIVEGAGGALFAMTDAGTTFRFNPASQLWVKEPLQPYAPSGLGGVDVDSHGNVWLAAWFELHKWDGATWTTVGSNWGLFDLGGVDSFAVGPDDTLWVGTVKGLLRWNGATTKLYTKSNSPLPANGVKGIDVRIDGVLGLSCSDFGPVTPFPNGVAVVAGSIDNPASWSQWSYGSSPLPHYQLGRCLFDAEGNLWVSAVSEGAAVLLHPAQRLATNDDALSASAGGVVQLVLRAGPANAGRSYWILGSVSGTAPGVLLPGGLATLPLNWDAFTDIVLGAANSPVFSGFSGTLDGAGRATALLHTLAPVPAVLAGLRLRFAYGLSGPWNFVSNAVSVSLTP